VETHRPREIMTLYEATYQSAAGPDQRGRTTTRTLARAGGRYRTTRLLGRGGTAEVFAGVDTHTARQVAVKRLHEHLASDPVQRRRFRREASSAAQVHHPGVVAVLATDEVPSSTGTTSVPIIVMELMEGGSLRDAQRRSRPTVGRSLEITADILAALSASHSAGIVHRDIKPGNVLFTSDGRVKIADFGTACSVSDTVESEAETSTVTGTVHYMAPEQARGLPVDQRSDLYAVGCLLYELVVGRPPFTGESAISVSYQQVTRRPQRPSTLDPGLPCTIDTVLERALQKDRADRYQTAAQMRADLVAARRELDLSPLGC
jgi:serine/threonine protein kinase